MKTKIKTLNYTESLLFCLATLFNRDVTKLSFYTKEVENYLDTVYQQGIETLRKHQKLDRALMQDNLRVFDESTWYFVYKSFTRLSELTFNKDIKIVEKALDYDYKNFPDELWKYNNKDNFRPYKIFKFQLPPFVVYEENDSTKLIFFNEKVASEYSNYLEKKYEDLELHFVVERNNNIVHVAKKGTFIYFDSLIISSSKIILSAIKINEKEMLFWLCLAKCLIKIDTFFCPQMLNDYWIGRTENKFLLSGIILTFLLIIISGFLDIELLFNILVFLGLGLFYRFLWLIVEMRSRSLDFPR
ncbi:hypothetical protein [Crocosphaera chwakensis]|uniref:Uncharacterized protein n=1 Tax=Crocosphaera chwakensis CCY0110 TaxID=391612 RepID=A3IZ52_9CHRO|nr:hypothetical protein [Crocosphaera chwakensis]EAZ88256.1 hypothetical protein CY0110_14505 [Crocosphaera chwakensis CCY0110]